MIRAALDDFYFGARFHSIADELRGVPLTIEGEPRKITAILHQDDRLYPYRKPPCPCAST